MDVRQSTDSSRTVVHEGSAHTTDDPSQDCSSMAQETNVSDSTDTAVTYAPVISKFLPEKLFSSSNLFPGPTLPTWLHPFPPNGPLQESLGRIYHSFFGLFERQLSQRLDQFAHRLDNFQREQAATKFQLGRLERMLHNGLDYPGKSEDPKPATECNGGAEEQAPPNWYDVVSANAANGQRQAVIGVLPKVGPRTDQPPPPTPLPPLPIPTFPFPGFTAQCLSNEPRNPISLDRNSNNPPLCAPPVFREFCSSGRLNPMNTTTSHPAAAGGVGGSTNTNSLFHSSLQSQMFWNQWMTDWLRASSIVTERCPTTSSACSFTSILEKIRATDCTTTMTSAPTCTTTSGEWQDATKVPSINTPYRTCKLTRLRGRRLRGHGRNIWSHLYDGTRNTAFKRAGPYTRPGCQFSPGLGGFIKEFGLARTKTPDLRTATGHVDGRHINGMSVGGGEGEQNGSHPEARQMCYTHLYDQASYPSRTSGSSSHASAAAKSANLVGNPIVILNPKEPREIFIGGIHTVPLPLWAYKKCLTMVRGEPHELGPRLCLRLLQSLFSLNYLVTHNYNGSGGKAPIDPTVMGAVLRQAQIQFGSGYFFTEPMALGKLRDYLNNAFRVMAFRQRKGERVRSPFWNDQGEPVHGLEAPIEFADTSDVIVLSPNGDVVGELMRLTSNRTATPGTIETGKSQEASAV